MKSARQRQDIMIACVAHDRDGAVLAIRNGKEWRLPQGTIGLHELPEGAVKRIVWEQTGMTVSVKGLLPSITSTIASYRAGMNQTFRVAYVAEIAGGSLRDPDRSGTSVFVQSSKLAKDVRDKNTQSIIRVAEHVRRSV